VYADYGIRATGRRMVAQQQSTKLKRCSGFSAIFATNAAPNIVF
jgi:hypothetical protein